MKSDADFRDDAAIEAMRENIRAYHRGKLLINDDLDPDEQIAILAWDSAAALLAERTKRFGQRVPANPAPVFELPEDEPIPYRPATIPPPALADADELMPAVVGSHETQPAPAPDAEGTVFDASTEPESIDAAWGAVTDARGPLRECEEGDCGCHSGKAAT